MSKRLRLAPHQIQLSRESLPHIRVRPRAALDAPDGAVVEVAQTRLRERSRGDGQLRVTVEEGESARVVILQREAVYDGFRLGVAEEPAGAHRLRNHRVDRVAEPLATDAGASLVWEGGVAEAGRTQTQL